MNLKPAPLKIIFSIAIGLIGGVSYSNFYYTFGGPNNLLGPLLLGFFILGILVYFIWSFFQKE